ncbi:hypothetical protein SAMN05428969_3639 [Devosia sp. YR412]|uniref:hypothetical protein n=1 Tax=Devosia sp. YR412 TaxID=1881030 RepID=UPI0008C16C1F|nr:hypothetical protein [Devosia sp. YR412]SEQ59944.1 hypothetical protein SAMN05428969_3639 [Devosia sp. YR412]
MDRRQFLGALAAAPLLTQITPAFADTPSLRFRDMYSRGKDLSEAALVLQGLRIEPGRVAEPAAEWRGVCGGSSKAP